MSIDVEPERGVPSVQLIAGDPRLRVRAAGHPLRNVRYHFLRLERRYDEQKNPCIDRGDGRQRDPWDSRRPDIPSQGDGQPAADDDCRHDQGGGRQVQLRKKKIPGGRSQHDQEWTDETKSSTRAAMFRRIRRCANVAPRARNQEAERRSGGKHVMIEPESREREETDDGHDPGPKQHVNSAGAVAPLM